MGEFRGAGLARPEQLREASQGVKLDLLTHASRPAEIGQKRTVALALLSPKPERSAWSKV